MTTLAGSQLKTAAAVLSTSTPNQPRAALKLIFQFVISMALLVGGAYVLIKSGTSSELQKAATGWIGLVVGYWLK
jgi:hypothetical protein